MMLNIVRLVLLACSVHVVFAFPTQSNEIDSDRSADGFWNIPLKLYDSCNDKDMLVCLGTKSVVALERVSRMASFDITDGVKLIRNEDVARGRNNLNEVKIQKLIETAPDGKLAQVRDLIKKTISTFIETHSLQLQLPQAAEESLQRAVQESRQLTSLVEGATLLKLFKTLKKLKEVIPLLAVSSAVSFFLQFLSTAVVGKLLLKTFILGKFALAGVVLGHILNIPVGNFDVTSTTPPPATDYFPMTGYY